MYEYCSIPEKLWSRGLHCFSGMERTDLKSTLNGHGLREDEIVKTKSTRFIHKKIIL
jgi:hypothetical protein